MKIKVTTKDFSTFYAENVESTTSDTEQQEDFFVCIGDNGHKLLCVALKEILAVEYDHDE